MLKLFHARGACSGAPYLALEEAGVPFELVPVDTMAGENRTPEYLKLNPKGRVPVLVDDDFVLTEASAILRYVSRLAPAMELWPTDPREDARCAEWLNWGASGVHVAYAHIRRAERYADSEAGRAEVVAKGRETTRATWRQVDERFAALGTPWAAGSRFSVADLYMFIFWTWGKGALLSYDMEADFPHWTANARKVAARPAVRAVAERDGMPLPA